MSSDNTFTKAGKIRQRPHKRQLTTRQILFAKAYAANGGRGRDAAVAAGYADNHSAEVSATKNLKMPEVRKMIEKNIKQIEKELGINSEWKLRKLKKMVDNNEDDRPKAALSALDMINKLDGEYAPERHEIEDKSHIEQTKEALEEAIRKNKMGY